MGIINIPVQVADQLRIVLKEKYPHIIISKQGLHHDVIFHQTGIHIIILQTVIPEQYAVGREKNIEFRVGIFFDMGQDMLLHICQRRLHIGILRHSLFCLFFRHIIAQNIFFIIVFPVIVFCIDNMEIISLVLPDQRRDHIIQQDIPVPPVFHIIKNIVVIVSLRHRISVRIRPVRIGQQIDSQKYRLRHPVMFFHNI